MAKAKVDINLMNEIGSNAAHVKNDGQTAAQAKVKAPEPFLGGPETTTNARIDLDKKLHRSLKNLATITETEDKKAVSMRMLVTEALLDVFEKYNNGEGKYSIEKGEEWNWKI